MKKDYLLYFKKGEAWMCIPLPQADEEVVNAIISNVMAEEGAESCQVAEVIRTVYLEIVDQESPENALTVSNQTD